MTRYSKLNVVYRLQKWMDSVPGQTFLNYAYSWGASIVILGTLFKLTHLPGANFFLFLGMGTEVFVGGEEGNIFAGIPANSQFTKFTF